MSNIRISPIICFQCELNRHEYCNSSECMCSCQPLRDHVVAALSLPTLPVQSMSPETHSILTKALTPYNRIIPSDDAAKPKFPPKLFVRQRDNGDYYVISESVAMSPSLCDGKITALFSLDLVVQTQSITSVLTERLSVDDYTDHTDPYPDPNPDPDPTKD